MSKLDARQMPVQRGHFVPGSTPPAIPTTRLAFSHRSAEMKAATDAATASIAAMIVIIDRLPYCRDDASHSGGINGCIRL